MCWVMSKKYIIWAYWKDSLAGIAEEVCFLPKTSTTTKQFNGRDAPEKEKKYSLADTKRPKTLKNMV